MKKFAPAILFLLFSFSALANDTIIIGLNALSVNSSLSGYDDVDLVARDSICLGPGFIYSSGSDGTLNTQLDPWSLEKPEQDIAPGTDVGYSGFVDGSKVVGSISGQVDVSSSGGATYNIPITVPPGTNGIIPQLAIHYNSQAGMGIMGRGWNLSGLSTIMATGKTFYYDGESTAISEEDSLCRLVWDGQRLLESNSVGIDADTFFTEVFSNHLILNKTNGSIQYFEVLTQEGKTLQYGYTPDSRLELDNDLQWKWMLNRVIDPFGNTMVYHYTKVDSINQILLSEIEYGGDSTTLVNRISFHYSKAPEFHFVYVHDHIVVSDKCLDSISMESNSNYYGSYGLRYASISGESVLSELYQYDKENNSYNPTRISWVSPSVNLDAQTQEKSILSGNGYSHFSGDFTGDGISDLVAVQLDVGGDNYKYYLYEGSAAGLSSDTTRSGDLPRSFTHDFWDEIVYSHGVENCMGTPSGTFSERDIAYVFSGDFDGDGIHELFVKTQEWEEFAAFLPDDLNSEFTAADVITNGFRDVVCNYWDQIEMPKTMSLEYGIGNILNIDDQVLSLEKLLRFHLGDSAIYEKQYSSFPDLTGRGYSIIPEKDDVMYYDPINDTLISVCSIDDNPTRWGEFNGDGKPDYIHYDAGWKIMTYNGNTSEFDQEMLVPRHCIGLIDLNGDGITAFVTMNSSPDYVYIDLITYWNEWILENSTCSMNSDTCWNNFLVAYGLINEYNQYYSTYCRFCTDLECRQDFLATQEDAVNIGYEVFIEHLNGYGPVISLDRYTGTHVPQNPLLTLAVSADIDSDGKSDLLIFDENYLKKIYYDFTPSFSNGNISYTFTTKVCDYPLGDNCRPGDFNGDGNIEFLFPDSDSLLSFISGGFTGKLVSGIRNGMGVETRIGYTSMTDHSVYTKGTGAVYPVADLCAPVYIVENMSQDNGVADASFVEYLYEDAKIHLQGKGFLGFMETRVENDLMNTSQSVLMDYDTNFFHSFPKGSTRKVGSTTIGQSNQYISLDVVSGKRFRVETDSTSMTEILDGQPSTIKNYFSFNIDGLVEEKQTDYNGEASVTDRIWYIKRGSHLAEKPNIISKKYERNGQSATDSALYTYYSSGALASKKEYCGTDMELTTAYYVFDSFGNPGRITKSGKKGLTLSAGSIVKEIDYSSDGRFVVSTSDPLDHDKRMVYDPTSGLPVSVFSENRLETKFEFGAFGVKEKTLHSNNVEESTILQWAYEHPAAPSDSMFLKWTCSSGQSPVLTFFDEVGREQRTVNYGFDDETIYIDTEYDQKGRVLRKSLPYFESDSPLWTTFTYDAFGRILTESSPDSVLTSYEYNGSETEVMVSTSNDTITTRTKLNALGETVESEDHLGNIVYFNYYPDGKLDSSYVNTHSSAGTSFTYDAQGNRTVIKDPDAGTIYSLYDDFGRMVRQISAKGDTSTYNYDDLSRITSSTDARGDISYSYITDTTQASFGRLDSIYMGDFSHLEVFGYDPDHGNLLSERRSTMERIFTNSYAYDWFERPVKRTYPSGLEVEYAYTGNGDLKTVTSEGLTLWNGTSANAFGQQTSFTQGSYATTVNFDSFGKLGRVQTGSIVDMKYEFDKIGNLISREDVLTDQKEEFAYDDLNRLTDIQYYSGGNHDADSDQNITFDNCGNIISKTGLSSAIHYGENNTGPHAISSIEAPDTSYTPPAQFITYTCFNKVSAIRDTLPGGDSIQLDIAYGLANQRVKSVQTSNGTVERIKWFDMDYEEDSTSNGLKKYHYINGGNGLTAIFVKQGSGNDTMYYVMTDHLGSLTTTVNSTSDEVHTFSYNAWGISRSADDWRENQAEELFAGRGFTGHEHLMDFNLINMNGRIYDPVLGRFLSPDPYVQSPGYPNNYNRYTYCLNNPLIYTDPDGEWIHILIGGIIGGIMNLGMNADNIDNLWDALGYLTVGSIAGAGSAAIGMGVSSLVGTIGFNAGAITGATASFSAGFTSGAGNTWIDGGSFEQGLSSGLISGSIGGVSGGLIGGLATGIIAIEHGGDFWTGEGAKFESIAIPQEKITIGEGMEYSTEYAKEFSDDCFGEIKGLNELYADGSVPDGYVLRGDRVFNSDNLEITGITEYLGKRQSNVYLFKTIFSSKESLYLTMGHEYLHVAFNAAGIGFTPHTNDVKHASIYKWQYEQASLWNHEIAKNLAKYNAYRQYYLPRYDYRKYGFYILNARPW